MNEYQEFTDEGYGDTRRVKNNMPGVIDNLILGLYTIGGRLIGVGSELMSEYQEAYRNNQFLGYIALANDAADFLPIGAQISAFSDAVLLKMIKDYVIEETGEYRQPSKLVLSSLAEILGAIIPGVPTELLPTTMLLVMDAYKQVAEHKQEING